MEEKLQKLKEIMAEASDIAAATALLEWDMQAGMPSGGAEGRGYQSGTLSRLQHQRWTSDETQRLVEDLAANLGQLDPDSDDASLIRFVQREVQKRVRVPEKLVEEFSQVVAVSQDAWVKARHESDFKAFQPHLERVVDLRRQYASLFAPYDHVYDPLLDDYEFGMKTAEVQAIFNDLRPQQVELIKAIAAHPQVDDSFLKLDYPEQDQWDFSKDVVTRFGYDWTRGRLDKSAHPFSISIGLNDVRITTRVIHNQVGAAMFGTMHEAGHAMYEQGIAPSLDRTPLCAGASMAIHESQSRMWENLVGRSLPFWKYFFPMFKERFPAQMDGISLMHFYKGINRVAPSLIRVESDEATYNLHIMLRLELEIALMEGSLAVKDLPEAWNARMQEYLGITPPDDAHGVLQDIHWAAGLMGYFPTYALGNLVSAQLWECIQKDVPNLDEQMEQGKFDALLGWLRENVHRHGSKYQPQVLVERITGSKINPQAYVRYLKTKYGEIYGL